MFSRQSSDNYKQALPGIKMKTLCHGDKTLMTEFVMQAGSALPLHSHPHEQTGYLVSGSIVLTIDGERHEVSPGDSWCIASGIEHGAQIVSDSVAIEVFSPVREEYLNSEN